MGCTRSTGGSMCCVWPRGPCEQMEPPARVVRSIQSAWLGSRPARTDALPPQRVQPVQSGAGGFEPLLWVSEGPLCLLRGVGSSPRLQRFLQPVWPR